MTWMKSELVIMTAEATKHHYEWD